MSRLLSSLLRIEGIVAVTAYAVTCALLLADVISREFFSASIFGAQKLAVFGAIIAGILGLSIAVGNNAHLRTSFADNLLPCPWVSRVGDALSALLFGGLCWYAVIFVGESMEFGDKAEVIKLPLWPFQSIFVVGFGLAAFKHLAFAIDPAAKPHPVSEG